MEILQVMLGALFFYIMVMFVFLRLITPFMGFKKYKIPKALPVVIAKQVKIIESESKDAISYLNTVYELVRDRWGRRRRINRLDTLRYFRLIFRTDLNEIWENTTFAHCNTKNYVLACMLVHSRYFTENDFRLKHVFCNGVIHQYLQVRVDGRWIDADPANGHRNYLLGRHMGWFA